MTRLSPRVAVSVTGLSLAMMVGAMLLSPAIAEKAEDLKDKVDTKVEKKVIIRKSFGGHHKPDAAELKEMIESGRESSATITTDAAEAKRLLDDAAAALAKGDESTARALVNEAHRLLDCGGPQFMGFGGGPGMMHAFAPEGDFDFDIDFQHGPGGPGDVMVWSAEGDDMQARELKIEIDGDTMTAEGLDKDGNAFSFTGTPEVVHAQLEAKGIRMQKHPAPMAGGHHMFMGGPGGHSKEIRIELPEGGAVPPFFGKHGGKMLAPLTEAERADLEKEVAAISEEAARLLRAGKSEEGLEKLHEAFGQSIRLGMAMDGKTLRFEKHFGSGAGEDLEMQIEVEVETDDAEAPEAKSVQPPSSTGRQAE